MSTRVLAVEAVLWTCQAGAAWIFMKSARHKVYDFAEVGEEFRHWGYARPAEVTFGLVVLWILGSAGLLLPKTASLAAVVLGVAMLVALATLVVNREWRRLHEPLLPAVLLVVVAIGRWEEGMLG